MGLGGRKVKQRIGADPRNLTWADDAAKFGQAYLTKLGWDPSRGLGVSGEGRMSHIKVSQKLNMLGVGAGSTNGMGDESVAWKQSRDYELLLKRLNEESGEVDQTEADTTEEKEVVEEETNTKKKRKRDGDSDVVVADKDTDKEKNKRKKNKKEKRKKDKNERDKSEGKSEKGTSESKEDTPAEIESPPTSSTIQAPTPRSMAHRARFLRSKQLASRSSSAIAEILGISGSSSNSPAGPSSLGTTPTPDTSQNSTPIPETNHDLRTASTSVGDYFKEKLAARALDRSKSGTPSLSVPYDEYPDSKREDDGETPRAGLGSKVTFSFSTANINEEIPRVGLGSKFGGLMGCFVTSKSSPAPLVEEARYTEQATEKKSKPKRKRKDERASTTVIDGEVTRIVETAETSEAVCRREKKKRKEKRELKAKKEKREKKRTSAQEDAS